MGKQSKILKMESFNIELELVSEDPEHEGAWLSGSIVKSDLGKDADRHVQEDAAYVAAVDAIESMVLAHAIAGIDINTPEYLEGLEVAVMAVTDRH